MTYSAALTKALKESAPHITQVLQQEAVNDGWPREVAASLHVRANRHTLDVPLTDAAFDLEYGSPDNTPSATIRKFERSEGWQSKLILRAVTEAGL